MSTPARSPLSQQELERQRRAIHKQVERGELTPAQAESALSRLKNPPVTRG